MEEDVIKIDELEYFNPFYRIKDQYTDLINSDLFFSDLNKQQQIFLYMACSDYIENDVIDDKNIISGNISDKTSTKATQNINIKHLYQLKKHLDQTIYSAIKFPDYSKENAIELNNLIKKLKINIKNYISTMDEHYHNAILHEYLDCINIPLEQKKLYKNEIPNIFYLQDITRTLKIFKTTRNKRHVIFNNWNKAFNLQNDDEILKFQGCLGLLLMNEFCKHYQSDQLNYCILPAALMTNLCINSPIYNGIEKKYLEELKQLRQNAEKISKANSSNAHMKAYKDTTLTEREYVFREAKNLINGKNKESFYRKDGSIVMSRLVKKIQNKRLLDGKETKTERTYIDWLIDDDYISELGDWRK